MNTSALIQEVWNFCHTLKDDSLDNLADVPPPDVLQQEIIDHLEAALAAFRGVASSLPRSTASSAAPR